MNNSNNSHNSNNNVQKAPGSQSPLYWHRKQQQQQERILTREMADRQARGKDPYGDTEFADDENIGVFAREMKAGMRPTGESWRERELRGDAMCILNDPELLMSYSLVSGETTWHQINKFKHQLCGLDESDSETDSKSNKPRRAIEKKPQSNKSQGQ